jgi:hypothetical protein
MALVMFIETSFPVIVLLQNAPLRRRGQPRD